MNWALKYTKFQQEFHKVQSSDPFCEKVCMTICCDWQSLMEVGHGWDQAMQRIISWVAKKWPGTCTQVVLITNQRNFTEGVS